MLVIIENFFKKKYDFGVRPNSMAFLLCFMKINQLVQKQTQSNKQYMLPYKDFLPF